MNHDQPMIGTQSKAEGVLLDFGRTYGKDLLFSGILLQNVIEYKEGVLPLNNTHEKSKTITSID